MSQDSATTERSGKPEPGAEPAARRGDLVTPTGRTTITDGVVSKVAAMAAREVGGVYAMGTGAGRAFGSVKERLPGAARNAAQGVSVEVGERQAAVDIDLVVDYGVSIPDLAGAVRENVIRSVEHMCGLEVVEVNVTVDDIRLPGEGEPERQPGGEPAEARVR